MENFVVKWFCKIQTGQKTFQKGVKFMSREDIHNIILEVADRIYASDNSPVSKMTEILMAEFYNSIEQLLTEVIYEIYQKQIFVSIE